jgi:phospholipid-binding lipoprotein MlaA
VTIAASSRAALSCAASLLLAVLLAGCATPPKDPAARAAFVQNNDPLEPMNRKILDFNLFIDRILLKPVAKVYIAIVPENGRDALRRALDNMKEPVVVINDVLQGELRRAGISLGRFAVNSTLGVGGLADVAARWGMKQQTGDFGQTLFVWGVPQGPYLVAPILGPSNPRDLFGMAADNYIDPFSYLSSAENMDDLNITRFVADGIDQRARAIDVLDDLQKNALDFYAQLRSLSEQHRAAELRRGKAPRPGTGFYQDPNAAPGRKAPARGFYDDPAASPAASREQQPRRPAPLSVSIAPGPAAASPGSSRP